MATYISVGCKRVVVGAGFVFWLGGTDQKEPQHATSECVPQFIMYMVCLSSNPNDDDMLIW